jgi:hypothetical protein
MSVVPGFEGIDDEFLEEFGQPVRVRPNVKVEPILERGPLLGIFRSGFSGVRLQDWEASDESPLVAVANDVAEGVILNDGEIDVSVVNAIDRTGTGTPIVLGGKIFWVSSWKTFKVADRRVDGIAMTLFKLHEK